MTEIKNRRFSTVKNSNFRIFFYQSIPETQENRVVQGTKIRIRIEKFFYDSLYTRGEFTQGIDCGHQILKKMLTNRSKWRFYVFKTIKPAG